MAQVVPWVIRNTYSLLPNYVGAFSISQMSPLPHRYSYIWAIVIWTRLPLPTSNSLDKRDYSFVCFHNPLEDGWPHKHQPNTIVGNLTHQVHWLYTQLVVYANGIPSYNLISVIFCVLINPQVCMCNEGYRTWPVFVCVCLQLFWHYELQGGL